MINKIIGGIAKRISSEFDGVTIYSEEISQGFKTPSFIIKLLNTQKQKGIGGRNKYINNFVIQYFPNQDRKNYDFSDVSKRILDCLQYIDAGRVLRGTNMKIQKTSAINLNGISTNYENGDGILEIFINFDFHEIYIGECDIMSTLKTPKTIWERGVFFMSLKKVWLVGWLCNLYKMIFINLFLFF